MALTLPYGFPLPLSGRGSEGEGQSTSRLLQGTGYTPTPLRPHPSRHAIFFEPLLEAFPSVLCLVLAVARTVIGMKPMRSIGIEHNL